MNLRLFAPDYLDDFFWIGMGILGFSNEIADTVRSPAAEKRHPKRAFTHGSPALTAIAVPRVEFRPDSLGFEDYL